jgi:hypothetical protein
MGFKCNTEGSGMWNITITPKGGTAKLDGKLEVGKEDEATGDFKGIHHKDGKEIEVTGTCRKSGNPDECDGTPPCHIKFEKDETEADGRVFHWVYEGDFKKVGDDYKTIDGTTSYQKTLKVRDKDRTGEEEGTWVGTKPPT